MKVHWWSCLLGLLCMPTDVILSTWEVSQEPETTIFQNINSSTEITCSTSLSEPLGVGLYRKFSYSRIVYLDFKDTRLPKSTIDAEFQSRTDITKDQQMKEGFSFTFQLSMLKQDDTDLYYCRWVYYSSTSKIMTPSSDGTVIIVREGEPQQQCKKPVEDLIYIILSATTAFIAILFLVIGALIVKCKRFKKNFRPARAVKPPRPPRPQHVCPEHSHHHVPYLITSLHNTDFRGIL